MPVGNRAPAGLVRSWQKKTLYFFLSKRDGREEERALRLRVGNRLRAEDRVGRLEEMVLARLGVMEND